MTGALMGGIVGVPAGVGLALYRRTAPAYRRLLTRNIAVAGAGGAVTALIFSIILMIAGKSSGFGLAHAVMTLLVGMSGGALLGISEGDKAVEAGEVRDVVEAASRDEAEEAAEEKAPRPEDARFTNAPRRPPDPRDTEDLEG
jgi:hypothetical protein